MEVLTLKKISPKELHERMQGEEKVLLLDVRAEEKYNEYHIEDSQVLCLNIPKTVIFNLEERDELAQISKDNVIITKNNQSLLPARLEIPPRNVPIFLTVSAIKSKS